MELDGCGGGGFWDVLGTLCFPNCRECKYSAMHLVHSEQHRMFFILRLQRLGAVAPPHVVLRHSVLQRRCTESRHRFYLVCARNEELSKQCNMLVIYPSF